jgi:hypothetical protein
MLCLKWVLSYCVLVGVGLWFGYRSHNALSSQEPDPADGHDCAATPEADASEPDTQLPTG